MWNYYNSNQKLSQPWGEVTQLPGFKLKKINWMIHLNKWNDILQVQFKERDSRPVRPIYLSPMHLLIGLIHVNFSDIFSAIRRVFGVTETTIHFVTEDIKCKKVSFLHFSFCVFSSIHFFVDQHFRETYTKLKESRTAYSHSLVVNTRIFSRMVR